MYHYEEYPILETEYDSYEDYVCVEEFLRDRMDAHEYSEVFCSYS